MSHLDKAIEVLNRALAADREAVSDILLHSFECNERMGKDFVLHTWREEPEQASWINTLALLNALFSYGSGASVAHGPIVATYDMIGEQVLITEVAKAELFEEEPASLEMVDHALMILNLLLHDDATAITQLMCRRVPCNQFLADDPTIQVALCEDEVCRVGALGIINGILGIDERGWGFVTMDCEDDEPISGFSRTIVPPPPVAPLGDVLHG